MRKVAAKIQTKGSEIQLTQFMHLMSLIHWTNFTRFIRRTTVAFNSFN